MAASPARGSAACQAALSAGGATGDQSCDQQILGAVDNARASLGLPAMVLPASYEQMTLAEQLLTLVDLERTADGIAPVAGSAWAGSTAGVLQAFHEWIYGDGYDPGYPADGNPTHNIDCTSAGAAGCWGCREALLMEGADVTCPSCTICMGAADTVSGRQPSTAAVEVATTTATTRHVTATGIPSAASSRTSG